MEDKERYPFYPDLPEQGRDEAQRLIDWFKDEIKCAAEEVIGDLYTDVAIHIESDSWSNYRNHMTTALQDYRRNKSHDAGMFKAIREKIYRDYRDEIIKDLDADLVEENERLKEQIKHEQELRRY